MIEDYAADQVLEIEVAGLLVTPLSRREGIISAFELLCTFLEVFGWLRLTEICYDLYAAFERLQVVGKVGEIAISVSTCVMERESCRVQRITPPVHWQACFMLFSLIVLLGVQQAAVWIRLSSD